MAFIPALDTAQVALHYLVDSQRCENIFYVQKDSTLVPADLDDIANAFGDWWTAHVAPLTPSNVSLQEIIVRDMTTETSPEIVFTTGLPFAGSSSAHSLPNNVTIAIKLNTGFGGRSFRGRSYIVGISQGDVAVDTNVITSGSAAARTTAWNELITLVNAISGMSLVVASFHSAGAPRSTAVLTPVTSMSFADLTLDSQRRRLPGRGS